MALVTWSSKFSVGVQFLDDQHSILVESLNELHEAMMKGHARCLTGALLRSLAAYTRDHFSAEESMLEAAEFPALAQHRSRNRDLTKQGEEYIVRLEHGEITLTPRLLTFLRDWLTNHILKEDREFGPWLREHGLC
jgi:hemerythrin-like metal-binding protein